MTLLDAEASQGLNLFNPSDSGSRRTRTRGDAHFNKITGDITRTQALFDGFSLFTAVTGQYSPDLLLAGEQFSVGGSSFGGAYDPAEITGDSGVAARAELRYGRQTSLSFLNSYQAFGYYDAGVVWNRDNSTADNHTLASTGLGVRANLVPWLSGSAEVGFPIGKEVSTENDRDPRFFFSVTGRF